MKQKLGILGGLGPMAGARFLETVTAMTDAGSDSEHLEVILHSVPDIPDRTAYLLDPSRESPVPGMIRVAQALERSGAQVIAIPCVTSHVFYRQIAGALHVPVLNAVEETARYLLERGITKAGLLATDGTVRSGLFFRALDPLGISVLTPARQDMTMQLIYGSLKQGKRPNPYLYYELREDLKSQGAEVILLGCTELSLLRNFSPLGPDVLDVSAILARAAVLRCGGKLRAEYEDLFVKNEKCTGKEQLPC